MEIVREKVYPDRIGKPGSYSTRWWQFGRRQEQLYQAVAPLKQFLAFSLVSKYLSFVFYQGKLVISHACGVIAQDTYEYFACLQSSIHEIWARKYSSTLETRLRYNISDCLDTFPFPSISFSEKDCLYKFGYEYYRLRSEIMLSNEEGLTTTYNRFHNPKEKSQSIIELREISVNMDNSLSRAYGWDGLDLNHGFHDTPLGVRFTINETARREVLNRLLRLNHERYEEEVRQGLHEKGKKDKEPQAKGSTPAAGKRGRKPKVDQGQGSLF